MSGDSESQPAARRENRNSRPGLGAAVSIVLALAGGLALRLWMMTAFPQVSGDPLIYGDLAKNLLRHGQFAFSNTGGAIAPTLIRLPGYPLFLALCFRLFGMENYAAAGWVQIALELIGCLLLADFVRRIASPKAAQYTLWLAAMCPFTAIYAGAPLTETPTCFCLALALWSMQRFTSVRSGMQPAWQPAWPPAWRDALLFTAAVTFAALLRPDGALVAVALAPPILVAIARTHDAAARARKARIAAACLLMALTPFAIWTYRNWRVFHVVQPLAPRYATDPGEDTFPGFQRWMKTWCLDFVSTYYVYWHVSGEQVDIHDLPARAFDSPAQLDETVKLLAAYEDNGEDLSAEIDAGFARLAAERIAAHPLRYYAWLPLGRLADMWLRPRIENLPIDLDWWVYSHHYAETRFSWFYAGLNAVYVLLGIAGLCLRPRYWPWMLAYFALRSALLTTIEGPEARYTIECFPMLFALGGIALYRLMNWVFLAVLKVKASDGSD